MPELNWTYGYAYALTLMAAVGLVLWAWFKRSGWL
jgi:magnesium transporter